MLSVTVHKDIGEYKEKVVGKMSARTLACTAGAIAASFAAAAIAHFAFGVPVSDAAFPVTAASMPFWLLGFWRPKGLAPEAFVPLWASHVLGDGKLPYLNAGRIPVFPVACQKPDRKAGRKAWKRGAEKRDLEEAQESGR
ncbi:PrgI family mobile element protein [Hugonella massiliensis]|jgi:hypothetical protein|uniref:PrgI family mobile element protein n=1 Tax=Hugonella massiliensis TaxID=1720315 RepID=UPI00073ECD90|nr:PrgI family protein [Hugonella massiliensis]